MKTKRFLVLAMVALMIGLGIGCALKPAMLQVPIGSGGDGRMILTNGHSPAVSIDGSLLVFVRNADEGGEEIHVDRLDKAIYPLTLTRTPGHESYVGSPTLLPNGSVAYRAEGIDYSCIYGVPAKGGLPTRLAYSPYEDHTPKGRIKHYAYSGEEFCLLLESPGEKPSLDLWLVNENGTNPRILAEDCDMNVPSFVDGRVAYASHGNIFVVDRDGSNRLQLTESGECREPVLSPNGRFVVYVSREDGNDNLHHVIAALLNMDHQLTFDEADDYSPSISSDSDRIAFVSTRNGNQDIYVLEVGNTPVQVTTESAEDYGPIIFLGNKEDDRLIFVTMGWGEFIFMIDIPSG